MADGVEDAFDQPIEGSGSGAEFAGFASQCGEGGIFEGQFDSVQGEETGLLPQGRFFSLAKDLDQVTLGEFVEGGDRSEAADEFGDEAELHEVASFHLAQRFVVQGLQGIGAGAVVVAETGHALRRAEAATDNFREFDEGAGADEEHAARVDGLVIAVVVFAGIDRSAVEESQQAILDPFAADVADAGVAAADLVDFIEEDDAAFRAPDIAVAVGKDPADDALDGIADITGFHEGGRAGEADGDVEQVGEAADQESFSAAAGSEEEDVLFPEIPAGGDGKIMVVGSDGEFAFGLGLADDETVEAADNLPGIGQPGRDRGRGHASTYRRRGDLATVVRRGADSGAASAPAGPGRAGFEGEQRRKPPP